MIHRWKNDKDSIIDKQINIKTYVYLFKNVYPVFTSMYKVWVSA